MDSLATCAKFIIGVIVRCGHSGYQILLTRHLFLMVFIGSFGLVLCLIAPIIPIIPTMFFADGMISEEAALPTWDIIVYGHSFLHWVSTPHLCRQKPGALPPVKSTTMLVMACTTMWPFLIHPSCDLNFHRNKPFLHLSCTGTMVV